MTVHIIDESKAITADFRHRALRHHAEGIFMLVMWTCKCGLIFGVGGQVGCSIAVDCSELPSNAADIGRCGCSVRVRPDFAFCS
jgi:hypothetical protein